MPANVETAVYANTPAWHGEGIVLDTDGKKGLTIEEALPASGLDWEVERVPIFGFKHGMVDPKTRKVNAGATPIPILGKFGVQRKTDNAILGVVGATWQPVQNTEGFAIINDVIEQAGGEVWIEAGGSLDGGKKVWILAHVDHGLQIAGEDYLQYIVFMNGHDGRTSVTALMSDVRVVCQNTLAMSIRGADKHERIVRVRHTTKAKERITAASHILGLRNKRAEDLAKQGEWLVNQKFSDKQWDKFLEELLPIKEEDTPAATMVTSRRDTISELYHDAENLEPIRDTKWGALQAVVEYSDYHRQFQNNTTQLKAQWGITPATIKQRAYDLLTA